MGILVARGEDGPTVLVTGAAGFIGSHLTEALLAAGYRVIGVDALTQNYDITQKIANLRLARSHPRFRLETGSLCRLPLGELLAGTQTVFHLAALPGVRKSWGANFPGYTVNNLNATQRLLAAVSRLNPPPGFIFASSSSVYGNAPLPMGEDGPTRPLSPYGLTKLAGEHLVRLYGEGFGIPFRILRFFTVYGPRQRPDMGFHRCMTALAADQEIPVYGDGRQTRDFTFVGDVVAATQAAAAGPLAGEVINVAGGRRTTILDCLDLLQHVSGRRARLRFLPENKGEARDTWADNTRAQDILGFRPRWSLVEGLRAQWLWFRGGEPS